MSPPAVRHGVGYPGGHPPPLPARGPEAVELTLWTTALAPSVAYVTRIRRVAGVTSIVVLVLVRLS